MLEHQPNHLMQIYQDDRYLTGALAHFVHEGLVKEEGVALICTAEHWLKLLNQLPDQRLSKAAIASGQIIHLDAHKILDQIMSQGEVAADRVLKLINETYSRFENRFSKVRFYGELVDLLCEDGQDDQAYALESLWNHFLSTKPNCTLLCGYSSKNISKAGHSHGICQAHFSCIPQENLKGMVETDSLYQTLARLEMTIASQGLDQRNLHAELNATKSSLIQLGKLSLLGELFAGLAHEINNPLAILVANVSQLRKHAANAAIDGLERRFDRMDQALDRIVRVVKNVLKLSRQESLSKENLNVQSIIQDAIDLTSESLAENQISLSCQFGAKDVFCRGDAIALSQVFMNLIANARDAIQDAKKENGRIEVQVNLHGNDHVAICIADNGCGISEEAQQKIFLPFFTTKDVGKGTGLGLAIACATVREHGGLMACTSTLGIGSRFCVTLPTAQL